MEIRTARRTCLRISRHVGTLSLAWLVSGTLVSAQDVGARRVTLEQAQQQAAQVNVLAARLGELGVEAATQHRRAAAADYFPKVATTAWNLHFNKFLGQEIVLNRPLTGGAFTAALPLLGQDQTVVVVNVVQPITPLFQVREVVNVARADETIARAKLNAPPATTASAVEKAYFDLLIAQKEMALRDGTGGTAVAVSLRQPGAETVDAASSQKSPAARVKESTAALNALLGWPADTALELETPSPLVETLSLQQVLDKALSTNPEVIEAEQTVEKAKAASRLSKLEYMPAIAVIGGWAYQANSIPLLPRDFAYIGVSGTYNIFDSGKREHAVRERIAQVKMAETALELTKAKVTALAKASYTDLERSRALSQAVRLTEAATTSLTAKYNIDDGDMRVAQTRISLETLQLDAQHRQEYSRLKTIIGLP
jgi:outer membrane protein TolC